MRLALALTFLPSAPALAAIDPCHLDQMVADAAVVMQVADHEVSGPDVQGNCTLVGTVARSFRGEVEPGSPVEVGFACANPEMLVGGMVYHDATGVAAAKALELHLTTEGAITGHGQGLLLLDKLTKSPVFQLSSGGGC